MLVSGSLVTYREVWPAWLRVWSERGGGGRVSPRPKVRVNRAAHRMRAAGSVVALLTQAGDESVTLAALEQHAQESASVPLALLLLLLLMS